MLRRGRIRTDHELLKLSLAHGFAVPGPDGSFTGNAEVRGRRTPEHRYLARDEDSGVEWNGHNQPWTRAKAEGVFKRGIKRTLGMEHFEARGFYGPCPVEVYSTSPWHALAARRYLHPAYPPHLPYLALPAIRIYHDPLHTFRESCPRADADIVVLLDVREHRALIVGTFATENLLHSIRTLANHQLPREGILPVSAEATGLVGGSLSTLSFGIGPVRGGASPGAEDFLWSVAGLTASGNHGRSPSPIISSAPALVILYAQDDSGALPAAARLNAEQARYFFEQGYASSDRVTGKLSFDACYGASHLPGPATHYGRLFEKRLLEAGSDVWLVNTGRVGAELIPAEVSRKLVEEIRAGTLVGKRAAPGASPFMLHPPAAVAGVSSSWLKEETAEARAQRLRAFRATNSRQ